MQVEVDEIFVVFDFVNFGMDLLMSLFIFGIFCEKIGLMILFDFFVFNLFFKDVECVLGIVDVFKFCFVVFKQLKQQVFVFKIVQYFCIGNEQFCFFKFFRFINIVDDYLNCKVFLVFFLGSYCIVMKYFFMIFDGFGFVIFYIEIVDVGGDWVVWGFFFLFMKIFEEYKCGVYGMVFKFIEEMKCCQLQGLYFFVGWFVGGVIVYEIVFQLVKVGDEVEYLIIIDVFCFVIIEFFFEGFYVWFVFIGFFGDGDDKKIFFWFLFYFVVSVLVLSNYDVEFIFKEKCFKVMIIWCEDGVCKLFIDF